MSEAESEIEPTGYARLLAHITALDLIVRGLFVRWAEEAPDPIASNQRMLTAMAQSMRQVSPPQSEADKMLYGFIEEQLNEFQRNVDRRLRGLGHTS